MAIKNPFIQDKRVDKPNRNTFDLSFSNNFTAEFGKLYPVLCKEVVPGDSFRIQPTFGLRFMPMMFPVQTRMRAHLLLFYVRNRNLWKDWPDFYGQTKEGLNMPYLFVERHEASERFATGSLLDHLGVPTTVYSPTGLAVGRKLLRPLVHKSVSGNFSSVVDINPIAGVDGFSYEPIRQVIFQGYDGTNPLLVPPPFISAYGRDYEDLQTSHHAFVSDSSYPYSNIAYYSFFTTDSVENSSISDLSSYSVVLPLAGATFSARLGVYERYQKEDGSTSLRFVGISDKSVTPTSSDDTTVVTFNELGGIKLNQMNNNIVTVNDLFGVNSETSYVFALMVDIESIKDALSLKTLLRYPIITLSGLGGTAPIDFNVVECPFAKGSDGHIKIPISALPSRAYESIYNGFFRNTQNDPFKINGVVEYNKFIPNSEGGADSYPYDFHHAYWEKDQFTTALQSPQQGLAPLLGLTSHSLSEGSSIATYRITAVDDSGASRTINVQAEKNADGTGGKIVQIGMMDENSDHTDFVALQNAVDMGISINDLRNTNALQKWLEKNIRQGYRYRDQILSHYGVNVKYEELDMPEFIGGTSKDVNVSTIIQTVDQGEDSPLGSYAGNATSFGEGKGVTHYCDEHGFIMGIFYVTPIPSYSQVLNKMFTKFSPLDYYSPEFGHIAPQPIKYSEMLPIQASISETPYFDKTFGYQRAWYEYLSSLDEVHGEMRDTLRNYLVNRQFADRPYLNAEFLNVKAGEVNDIFAVTAKSDKIIGQIYFDITAKRPIPRYGDPRLD